MNIYSWNMLFNNQKLDHAFKFIAQNDFDIFCLQEVPEKFLERLKTLPFYITAATETNLLYGGQLLTQYGVILSRFPIVHSTVFTLPFREPMLPLRGCLFSNLIIALGGWARGLGNRHGIYADVETGRGIVRIFCLHLWLTNPSWRAEEFEIAMTEHNPSSPTIVCGDLNILEKPHITILNWILGGCMSDALCYNRERTYAEQRFVEHKLLNPLRGENTHSFARSQLDHILVSESLSIKNAEVISDRIGSDHHPIRVEIM